MRPVSESQSKDFTPGDRVRITAASRDLEPGFSSGTVVSAEQFHSQFDDDTYFERSVFFQGQHNLVYLHWDNEPVDEYDWGYARHFELLPSQELANAAKK